ncbi:MAG: hypothetical protein WCP21_11870, partial [Armatimonadota bacterium]
MRRTVTALVLLLGVSSAWCQATISFNGLPGGAAVSPRLTLCEGVSGTAMPGRLTSSGPAALQWTSGDGTVRCLVATTRLGKAVSYRLTVSTGTAPARRLLRAMACVPVTAPGPLRLWDGYVERKWAGRSVLERADLDYTFPVSCVYSGKRGLALGLTPDTITSTLHSGLRPVGAGAELFYETRLVVDAAHPQTVTFVTYGFEPTFGYLDAVQDYYDLFPAAFQPVDGVDSRIYGMGGYLISSYGTQRLQLNSARRAHTDWEWSYAPFVRSGDWYPEKGDWVEGTDVIRQYRNYRDEVKGTWEQYHEARTAQFSQGDKTSAMFYYVLVKETNTQLLEQYPTARLVTFAEFKGGPHLTGGLGALAGENSCYSSAYGTPLAQRLEEEMRKVVQNYEVSGFAFDMTNRSLDDYGPGQANCGVGRTFDDEGNVYSPDTISACLMADAIHKQLRGTRRMGVIMNQAISRSCCFPVLHADAVMYENLPNRNPQNVMPLRLMSGRKPFTFWGALENGRTNMGLRWDYADDPQAAREIRTGLAQHSLLTCLRIGATPMNWAASDLGREWIPTLIELKRLGWNPAPGVLSTSPDLWIGRFGRGEQTVITVSNPKRKRVQATLTVLDRYLGTTAYTIISDRGQKLQKQSSRDRTTLTVDLAPKEILVLRMRPAPTAPVAIGNRDDIANFLTEADIAS